MRPLRPLWARLIPTKPLTEPVPGKAPIASFDATSADTTKAPRFFPAALLQATWTVGGKR